ncbi:hypothetical protein M8C21_022165 [Ambrosia artemisiifolia]|uniref:Uncharacterized protein n=1 Tax=Ambrosia artemisiifolia TaxID=4212 RepID=A0AAD5G8V9_AMBAR|nr:hypothetical protein M8C21_022165 [Ambrosia artemisiifolia]
MDSSHGRQYHSLRPFSYVFKGTSTLELPLLTTLHLEHVILRCDDNSDDKCIDLFSKCTNLKNLTLIGCNLKGCKVLSICLPLLSNIELHQAGCGSLTVINIVAPQLKKLTITDFQYKEYLISAPNLVFLIYKGNHCLQLPANDYHFMEKADICVKYPKCAHQVLSLLQQLANVKFLTLSLEIVELLSSSMELMSNQPSPFANLKSLKIHPERYLSEVREHERVKMSAEVRGYLLDSSPGATFTMVSREEVRAMHDIKSVQTLIKRLRTLLEKEKARTESKMATMHEQGKAPVDVDMSWKDLIVQIEKGEEKASIIISLWKAIKEVLTRLPASNRATIQPLFSTLGAETDIVMKKITDCMKMDCDENQRRLSLCFHELATNLQSSS